MQSTWASRSDAQLLREYATRGVDPAFTELVRRHTNLVYSAALRQVGSPDVAADIAQNVFIGLARGAQALLPRLVEEASLAGWLCRSTRNLSLNFRRDEFRRQSRQKRIMEELTTTPADAPDWEQMCGLLDDAMAELSEAEYDLLVLRFYKSLDYRAVGAAMQLSDDAAQKRVQGTRSSSINNPGDVVWDSLAQFAQAHQGALPADAAQLLPYLTRPLDPAKVQEILGSLPKSITTLEQLKAAGQK